MYKGFFFLLWLTKSIDFQYKLAPHEMRCASENIRGQTLGYFLNQVTGKISALSENYVVRVFDTDLDIIYERKDVMENFFSFTTF